MSILILLAFCGLILADKLVLQSVISSWRLF